MFLEVELSRIKFGIIFLIFVLGGYNFYTDKVIDFSATLNAKSESDIEVFYSSSSKKIFTTKNSFSIEVSPDKSQISFVIPYHKISSLKIIFGDGVSSVKNISLRGKNVVFLESKDLKISTDDENAYIFNKIPFKVKGKSEINFYKLFLTLVCACLFYLVIILNQRKKLLARGFECTKKTFNHACLYIFRVINYLKSIILKTNLSKSILSFFSKDWLEAIVCKYKSIDPL